MKNVQVTKPQTISVMQQKKSAGSKNKMIEETDLQIDKGRFESEGGSLSSSSKRKVGDLNNNKIPEDTH